MFEGAAVYTMFMKMIPYVLGMKVVGGAVDLLVHAAKVRISKGVKF